MTVPARLDGGGDADKIRAGGGPSRISGGEDDDDLKAGKGPDVLDGGPGDFDRCRAKPGGGDTLVNWEVL